MSIFSNRISEVIASNTSASFKWGASTFEQKLAGDTRHSAHLAKSKLFYIRSTVYCFHKKTNSFMMNVLFETAFDTAHDGSSSLVPALPSLLTLREAMFGSGQVQRAKS